MVRVTAETIKNDLARFDNVETVSIRFKGRSGNAELNSVAGVLRTGVGRKFSSFANVQIQSDDVVFNIPDANITPKQMNIDDMIVDSGGVKYVVLAVDNPTFRTRWRCACRKLVGT